MIQCKECGAAISDKAITCIKCGAPLREEPTDEVITIDQTGREALTDQVITIEQTGKIFKATQALGVMLVCVGVLACAAKDVGTAAWPFILGSALYLGSRVGAWWYHG
jgi:uncharacterized membrane protein YvbJ